MAKYFTRPPLGTPLNPAHPLNRGLVLYMPFSEGAGSKTQDLSGKGNHGTLTNIVQGATSGWTGGKFGGGLNFDGVNDLIVVKDNVPLRIGVKLTITAILTLNSNKDQLIIQKRSDTLYNYGVWLTPAGMLFFQYYDSAYRSFTDTKAVTLNKATLISIVADEIADTLTFYQDGVLTSVFSNVGVMPTNITVDVLIGAYTLAGAYSLHGSLSELRIYNIALSPLEIQQLYTDPFCMYEQKGISRWAQLIKKGSFFFR